MDHGLTAPTLRRAPIAMVTHSYYEEDPRVRREAEALVAAGHPVDVFGLRRPDDPPDGEVAGVRVHRLDVQRHQGAGLATYLREYASFFGRAGWALARAHRRRRYALVQVHTLPDFLVFAALPLRLAGVPVLLDLHEAMPVFFGSRFPGAANPVVHALLALQERLSVAAATAAVTVNDALRERLVAAGIRPAKVAVVPNSPALARFDAAAHPRRTFREDGVVRLVYAGALTPTYELDVVLRAVASIATRRPDVPLALDLYGRGDSRGALGELAESLGVADSVEFHGRIPIEDVPAAVAAADIGLAPTRHDAFTDVSLSTKIFEYAAMGKPVVASRLPLVERTFPAPAVATYEPGEPASLAEAILRLVDDPAGREASVEAACRVVHAMSWEVEGRGYVELVEGLIGRMG
jgi:glycosyltransferase involved in cell wall biosynthesis